VRRQKVSLALSSFSAESRFGLLVIDDGTYVQQDCSLFAFFPVRLFPSSSSSFPARTLTWRQIGSQEEISNLCKRVCLLWVSSRIEP
jgi:hypothetical protein